MARPVYCVRISGMFLQWRACDRFSAWSCSLKRALYNILDSDCLECPELSILDTMQKMESGSES